MTEQPDNVVNWDAVVATFATLIDEGKALRVMRRDGRKFYVDTPNDEEKIIIDHEGNWSYDPPRETSK
jgi:hypothetical protein